MNRDIANAAVTPLSHVAAATPRLPTIPPAHYSEEQQNAADAFLAARKTPVYGPFEVLMHSPEVMTQARSMGDYLRFRSSIGTTLSELVILITARQWTQDYEWQFHYPIALKAGIRKGVFRVGGKVSSPRIPGGAAIHQVWPPPTR